MLLNDHFIITARSTECDTDRRLPGESTEGHSTLGSRGYRLFLTIPLALEIYD
jgi:hypothetical protein